MAPERSPPPLSRETENQILEACREAILRTQKRISDAVFRNPERAFETVRVPGKGSDHVTTRIDLAAQKMAAEFLREAGLGIKVEGEVSVRALLDGTFGAINDGSVDRPCQRDSYAVKMFLGNYH